jgi:hypothetical protein
MKKLSWDDQGGAAFPIDTNDSSPLHAETGMSLRDWFAGQAITTMISKCEDRDGGWDAGAVAAGCYLLADAMLAARNQYVHEDRAAVDKDA